MQIARYSQAESPDAPLGVLKVELDVHKDAGKMRANNGSPSMNCFLPSRPLFDSELYPTFTLPLGFIWELIPDMSRHCYNMEDTGAKQALLKLT